MTSCSSTRLASGGARFRTILPGSSRSSLAPIGPEECQRTTPALSRTRRKLNCMFAGAVPVCGTKGDAAEFAEGREPSGVMLRDQVVRRPW
jgi:hypothetical protein